MYAHICRGLYMDRIWFERAIADYGSNYIFINDPYGIFRIYFTMGSNEFRGATV